MEIKDYSAGDEQAITKLFEQVFAKPMSNQYWSWRFANNPCNKFLIKLMWDKNQLIGHYAVSPVLLDYKGKELITGLSMTTMTHPEYTGLGVFQQLSESLYEDMHIKHQCAGVWGFPNNNSHRGFVKNLGWEDITVLPMLSSRVNILKAKETAEVKIISSFQDAHADAYRTIFASYSIKVKKDAPYLNWRYVDNPLNNYTIFDFTALNGGFVVCKEYDPGNGQKGAKQVDIVEWCVPAEERMTKIVVQHLAHYFPSENYHQFNMWMPLKDTRHLHFEKLGFAIGGPVTYWGSRAFAGDNLSDEQDWWIQLGDSDVY